MSRVIVHPRDLLSLLTALAMAFLSLAYLYATYNLELLNLQMNAQIATGVLVLSLVLHCAMANRSYWSPSFVFVGIYTLFHFGIIVLLGLGVTESLQLGGWAEPYRLNHAIVLVSLGLVAFSLGASLANTFHLRPVIQCKADKNLAEVSAWLGLGLVSLSSLAWFLMAARLGGSRFFMLPYLEFLSVTEGSGIWFFYFPLGIGLLFLVASEKSVSRTIGLLVFMAFALIAFPLGLRGEVLFPVAAAVAMTGMKSRPLPLVGVISIVLILLCLIALIRSVRNQGLQGYEYSGVDISPAGAIAEMGGSIRPLVEVIRWQDSGEPWLLGSSYLAPFDRLMVYVVPGWTRPTAEDDARLLNVVVQRRVGPIGFSIIAEAFKNWGRYGVFAVMFLLGVLFGHFDAAPYSPRAQLFLGLLMFPLLGHIRNAFTQVPFQIGFGIFMLSIAVLLSKSRCSQMREATI